MSSFFSVNRARESLKVQLLQTRLTLSKRARNTCRSSTECTLANSPEFLLSAMLLFFFPTTYCSSLEDFRIDFGIFWQACRFACQNLWGSGVTMVHPPLRSKSRSVLLGCPSLTNSPDRRICSRSPVQDFGKQMSRNVACSNSRASHSQGHRVPEKDRNVSPDNFLVFSWRPLFHSRWTANGASS